MSTMGQASRPKKRMRKLLSLDGGGVRGLSSMMILRIFMEHVNRGREQKEPWQEFDMIGGTSTGGLLAIMLGRLRMSSRDCEISYAELSGAIFAPRRSRADIVGRGIDFLKANGRFDESPLEESIRSRIVAAGLDENALLEDYRPDACKVFVCATQVADNRPTLIRSYENPETFGDIFGVKIWEAARATSAATTFFDPIKIGDHGEQFADGALHHNNPIHQVYQEAKDLWPDDDYLLISIGTGSAPGQSINEGLRSLVEQLAKIATETEETARLFHKNHPDMVSTNRLFRFNVYHGLGTIGLDESKEMHQIASRTRTYLREPEVVLKAKLCVMAFKNAVASKATPDNSFPSEKDLHYPIFAQMSSASADKTDAAIRVARLTLEHSGPVSSVVFSKDGEWLVSTSCETVMLWNVASGAAQLTLEHHSTVVMSVAFSPDGKSLVSVGYNGTVIFWDTVTGAVLQTHVYSRNIYAAMFSPDTKLLAFPNFMEIELWDVVMGAVRRTLKGNCGAFSPMTFSPDGEWLASSATGGTVIVWEVVTGAVRLTLKGPDKPTWSVAFSPDGKSLASASGDKTIRLWDVVTGAARQTLKGHSGDIWSVAFSPDGKSLASASDDKTVRLWDICVGRS